MPIAVGTSFVLVARQGHQGLLNHDRFADVIAYPDLSPILQTQTTYTPYINQLLKSRTYAKTKGSKLRMIRSLKGAQHDYLIMLKIRAESLFERNSLTEHYALYDHYSDLSNGIVLHMGCSLTTNSSIIARFDKVVLEKGPLTIDR